MITERHINLLPYTKLTEKQIKQLEEWCEMKIETVLFDSYIHPWDINTSVMNEKIITKKNLLFLIETITGEKFGYFLESEIKEKYDYTPEITTEKTFHFNLESTYERLSGPMKFEAKDFEKSGYCLFKQNECCLLTIGDIWLYKEKDKKDSLCTEDNTHFNYHNISHALCGRNPYSDNITFFTPERILIFQMK